VYTITMETAVSYEGYRVPKDKITPVQEALIRRDLVVTPHVNSEYGNRKPKSFSVFNQDKDSYYVPRAWGVKHFGPPSKVEYETHPEVKVAFRGELRGYQLEIQKKLDAAFAGPFGGGVVCIPPGGGKTVIAIHHMCKMKKKTLVIVHKSFLMDQWKERLQQYTNASVGIIQQNKCDIKGRDVVIAMLQTLLSRDYTTELQEFDLMVTDEVHHTGAEIFSQVLKQTQVPYLLGLSATPEREDKLEKVFYWHLGDVIHRAEKKNDKQALIRTYFYQTKHEKFVTEINRYTKQVNMSKMITNITEIDHRNNAIVDIIKTTLAEEPERKLFVLTNRRNHIEELERLIKSKVDATLGLYIGGMKKEDLKKSEDKQVILGTYEMASEGLDIQDLDTLVLATPKSNIIQSIGRIMRKEQHEYTNVPLVIDIVDRLDVFYGMYNKRKKIYRENKYDVETFNVGDTIEKVQVDPTPEPEPTESAGYMFVD
jgi:superfamily II DNA or RNA helicase